jgi:membrane-bound lytic murein transglycosylase D
MTIKSAILILFFSHAFIAVNVCAETNLEGDYIVILDSPNNVNKDLIDPTFNISPTLKTDPAHSYLPDIENSEQTDNLAGDLRQRIINGYNMPQVESSFTKSHEAWYAARPDYIKRMIGRSQRYLYHIVVEVEKRGMPSEIALLPMVESAFNPQANSISKASGIWQFMPATGKSFGLKQDWWIDNRRNVTAATNAALSYLQKLHVMFGTWDLALAAYNAGEGTVQRAIDKNRKKGLPTDYASLPLPAETRNYVPKLQAIKNIMTRPEQFGLNIEKIPNRPYFSKVIAPEQIDAKLAASLAEISFEEFSSLNPEYNRPIITENGNAHEILLPVSAANTFKENLANYNKPLVSWQTYHIKNGERMDKIAKKFGIDVNQLREVNGLHPKAKSGKSQSILVPSNGDNSINESTEVTFVSDNPTNSKTKDHIVKPKETLASLGRLYKTDIDTLMQLNQLDTSEIQIGQTLKVPESVSQKLKQKNQSSIKQNRKNVVEKKLQNKSSVKKTSNKKNKKT